MVKIVKTQTTLEARKAIALYLVKGVELPDDIEVSSDVAKLLAEIEEVKTQETGSISKFGRKILDNINYVGNSVANTVKNINVPTFTDAERLDNIEKRLEILEAKSK